MKILFICNYGLLYGANRSLLSVVQYCQKKGDEVIVLVPSEGSMAEELKKIGIPYKVIRFFPTVLYVKPILKHLLLPFCFLYDILIFPYLLFFAKKINPDLIYSNTSAENIGVLLAKSIGKKHVSHIREFMSLDHDAHFVFGESQKRKYLKLSNGLIFVSKAVADTVMRNEVLKPNQKVIYNGLNMNDSELDQLDIPEHINFGLVGVLQSSKGHELCIKYFSEFLKINNKSTLHIFGEGYSFYEKKLKLLVRELNIEQNVIFHGFVKDSELIYNKINTLLVFARSEGFGRVTIEGMLRGIPVIGLKAGGTTELINHGETGFLFTEYEEFIAAIAAVFSSKAFYNSLRFNANKHARAEFSEEKYCSNVRDFLINLK